MYKGIIYKCTCLITEKVYIGQTTHGLKLRRYQHIWASKTPKDSHYKIHFCNALRKYGENNFEWKIIESCSADTKLNLKKLLSGRQKYCKLKDGSKIYLKYKKFDICKSNL